MPAIQSSAVIGKNEDGSDITQPKMLTSWSGEGTSDKLVFHAMLSWLVNSWLFLR
jgi:hypothetical protein